MAKLSVVLAAYNEEKNLPACLESVKNLADEIIIVDGQSKDRTVEIARSYGAKVYITHNHPIFHINKQKALELASHKWILQLDADEIVSDNLAMEILKIINMHDIDIAAYQKRLKQKKLFHRHQALLEARDGQIGTKEGPFSAFFVPRRNFFLGRYLRYGGVYPDGVIRLVQKHHAHFPARSVHEQIVVKGRVGWLQNDLLHMDSPDFKKYIKRWSRYTDLIADELKKQKLEHNPANTASYLVFYPLHWFLLTYIRHKGFLDSWQGLVFSFFSSLRFAMGYIKYISR